MLSCEGQACLGHEVHLAFGPIYGPEGSLLDRVSGFRTADGRRIVSHEIPDLIRDVHPIRDRRALRQLQELIRSIRPDIVHTHSSKAGILGRIAAFRETTKTYRPGIVHTIHGPPFMPIEGNLLQRTKIRFVNACYEIAERYAAKRCHIIVSVADAMTAQFLARRIGTTDRFTTVHSGIDTQPYLDAQPHQSRDAIRAQLHFNDDDIVIGTVARLAQHKGHDDLLSCLSDLLHVSPRIRLLWVGDGYKKDALLLRARELGFSHRDADTNDPNASIVLTGLVPPARVPGLMRAMDILAHPSSREGLPRTIPQALLSGVVPVAYDIDGTREACIDRVTGILVPHGNRTSLRNALVELVERPDERRRLARDGFAFVRDAFSSQRMVNELERVYQQAIERAKS